jgi:hypothetical protein
MPVTPIPALDRTSSTFKTDVDTLFLTRLPLLTVELNQVSIDLATVGLKQDAAAASATAAGAAAEAAVYAANASQWVSGTTYAKGAVVWSPANLQTYRRVNAGAGTTDPSSDLTNWTKISSQGAYELIASATTSSAVANIDFPNIFTSEYEAYVIEVGGIKPTGATDRLSLRFSADGVVFGASNADYFGPLAGGATTTTSANQLIVGTNFYAATGGAGAFTIRVRNALAAMAKPVSISGTYINASSNLDAVISENLFNNPTVKGFRLFWNAGTTFQSGARVRVYGIRTV